MSCGTITIGSNIAQKDRPSGGTRARFLAFNYDEVLPPTVDADGRITAFNVVEGAEAKVFTGCRNDMKKSMEAINIGVGANMWKHICGWIIYERTQEQKNNIDNLLNARLVIIAENKGKDDDAIEVIGLDVGVEIVLGVVVNAHENGGYFTINMATPEGEAETALPPTLGADYEAGETILEALIPVESE